MRLAPLVALAVITAAPLAHAGHDKLVDALDHELDRAFGMDNDEGAPAPRFAMVAGTVVVAPKTVSDAISGHGGQVGLREVAGLSADKTAAWLDADLVEFEVGCGDAPCPPPPPPPPAQLHATVLYEQVGADWRPVVWDVAQVTTGKAQAAAIKKGAMPDPMPSKIDGADDAVAVFQATIGDPKALAKSVSARKDVVLYGSEAAERVVGGAQVAAKLTAWNLAFKVRDGISAGVTSSKTVAWIAANLDASSAKKPKDKPVPYRALLLYEKQGRDWKLVSANFAYLTGDEY